MSDLFPKLEPPAGGLARLRAKLDAAERPHRAWLPRAALAGATVAASAAIAVVFAWPAPRPSGTHLALLTPPREPVVARDGSSVEPVSFSDQVVFYRIGQMTP